MSKFGKVAVIGAGQMGSSIAAHVANAGVPVVLLDVVPGGTDNRNLLAESALASMLKATPAPFMHRGAAKLITTGNLEDHMDLLRDADWICEAVVEDLATKQNVYRMVEGVRGPVSIVTSNTSTIPLTHLVDGLPASFAEEFAITHFFNPPRYMRLLELVSGPTTRPEVTDALHAFCDVHLGKEVVRAKDTPGFIGNRIGIYWYYVAMSAAIELGLTVEEADAIVGPPMGIPKTGIFGLIDLTGIDLAPKVNATMLSMLPPDDAFCREFDPDGPLNSIIFKMITDGFIGRKGKGGFYRMLRNGSKREMQVRDVATGVYRAVTHPRLESVEEAKKGGLRALVSHPDKGGQYAWRVLSRILPYAASLVPDVADAIRDVDRAMKSGYGWKFGPFEMIDQLGCEWFVHRLSEEGVDIPPFLDAAAGRPLYRETGQHLEQLSKAGEYKVIEVPDKDWSLADMKRGSEPIAANGSASLWDVGDGVACLEFHSKMNAIDDDILSMVREAANIHQRGYKALIIGHDSDNFSVGANVGHALFAANTAMWPLIEEKLKEGQQAHLALKYAPFPVVGAPAGMTLGGGCEIMMHCDAVQAHAETYIGLVEAGIGLIPGWGGTKEMIVRAFALKGRPGGPMPPVVSTFETISLARVSKSAREAQNLRYLRSQDDITMNRKRVLADAKAKALALALDYDPPQRPELGLPGSSGLATLRIIVDGVVRQGKASEHDRIVSLALADVLTGGETDTLDLVDEEQLLSLERNAVMSLIRQTKTLDRIEYMLDTGKSLRN
jgi:3-hydroxyacyl-CoA dehydrogenase